MHLLESFIGLILLAAMIYSSVTIGMKDTHKEIQEIKRNLSEIKMRIDKMELKIERNDSRVDHLYQICIEMLGTKHKIN